MKARTPSTPTTVEINDALSPTAATLYNRVTFDDDGYISNLGAGSKVYSKVAAADSSTNSYTDVTVLDDGNYTLKSTADQTVYYYDLGTGTFTVSEKDSVLTIEKADGTKNTAVISDDFTAWRYDAVDGSGANNAANDTFREIDVNTESGKAAGLMGTNDDLYVVMNKDGNVDYIVIYNKDTTYSLTWAAERVKVTTVSGKEPSGTYTAANFTVFADVVAWTTSGTVTVKVNGSGLTAADYYTLTVTGSIGGAAAAALDSKTSATFGNTTISNVCGSGYTSTAADTTGVFVTVNTSNAAIS